ncbi:MAG: hypothetical protein KGI58_03475 [Patescibacteria group bacterium]|nr:hypothetical protein [Patescibacteria group bacterium]
MKKNILIIIAFIIGLLPFLVFAAPQPSPAPTVDVCSSINIKANIGNIFNWASCTIIKSVVPLLFTLATAAFIWGITQYLLNADNEEKRKKGKSYMIWGIIALFVMISMWGLVGILTKTFGVQTLIPQLSIPKSSQ